MTIFSRRRILAGTLALPVLGLASNGGLAAPDRYTRITSEPYDIPAIEPGSVRQDFLRQSVSYSTKYGAGSIVVDPMNRYLYLIQGGGRALRYGVGVGKAGFAWSGRARVGRKAQWPRWTPPAAMIQRRPDLAPFSAANGGYPPGPTNPLGARALYLFKGSRDTLYRIHGTNEPWSIGQNMSSGCIRMLNHDVIDLYNRVRVGAPVIVLGNAQPAPQSAGRVRRQHHERRHRGLY